MTKEEFKKVWHNSSKEDILNQYYYDYKEKQRLKEEIKWIMEAFEKGYFEDGCDCIKIYDYLKKNEA